jgi:hypothetical protein
MTFGQKQLQPEHVWKLEIAMEKQLQPEHVWKLGQV